MKHLCRYWFFYLQTLVEETTSKEVYKDTHSLLSEITQDITSQTSIGLSFKFTPTDSSAQNNLTQPVSVTAGFDSGTEKREMIKTMTDHSTTKVSKMLLIFLVNHVAKTFIQIDL